MVGLAYTPTSTPMGYILEHKFCCVYWCLSVLFFFSHQSSWSDPCRNSSDDNQQVLWLGWCFCCSWTGFFVLWLFVDWCTECQQAHDWSKAGMKILSQHQHKQKKSANNLTVNDNPLTTRVTSLNKTSEMCLWSWNYFDHGFLISNLQKMCKSMKAPLFWGRDWLKMVELFLLLKIRC